MWGVNPVRVDYGKTETVSNIVGGMTQPQRISSVGYTEHG
jgi:hypothetical protein